MGLDGLQTSPPHDLATNYVFNWTMCKLYFLCDCERPLGTFKQASSDQKFVSAPEICDLSLNGLETIPRANSEQMRYIKLLNDC